MSWNVHGHELAESMLSNHIANGNVRHAYLFAGVSGCGRRTMALRFAMALNCKNPPSPGSFCGSCRSCVQFEQMRHPDLTIVQAEDDSGRVKVEQIRTAQHTLSLAPFEAPYRIALLLRFQEANANAQNALLKTLEEPPGRVILLLTADSTESLLPTIVSRCEVVRMQTLPLARMETILKDQYQVDERRAHLLAHLSGGRLGSALKMKDDAGLESGRQEQFDAFRRLLEGNVRQRFRFVEEFNRQQSRSSSKSLFQAWSLMWRDLYFIVSQARVPLVNIDFQAELHDIAAMLDAEMIRHALRATEQAHYWMESTNMNMRLVTEGLLLSWPHISA